MSRSSWSHGYFSADTYTSHFFRELAPAWLDYTAFSRGFRAPRLQEGIPFRYLELGSGMGFGLSVLAALYPEGQFVGIDFQPDHIAHSVWLAQELGLSNISFRNADVVALAADPLQRQQQLGPEAGFAYVVSHGVYSWVTSPVQRALLQLARHALQPGGLFYCSYNSQPGWLALAPFQHILRLERQRSAVDRPYEALHRTVALFQQLQQQHGVAGLPLLQAQPTLQDAMARFTGQPERYLLQEYDNEGWAPLFVADMHRACDAHQLRYVGSATLTDNFEDLLPPAIRQLLEQEPSPAQRLSLIDVITNKAFRRDVFALGLLPLTTAQLEQQASRWQFRLLEAPAVEAYQFQVAGGEVSAATELYARLEQSLQEDGVVSLLDLAAHLEQSLPEQLRHQALLLQAGRLGLDRGSAATTARPAVQRVNQRIAELMMQGCAFSFLPEASMGTALSISALDLMIYEACSQGLEGDALLACLQSGLATVGLELRDPQSLEPITDPAAQLIQLQQLVHTFQTQRFNTLKTLALIPAHPIGS